jgi:hypothetical protein
MDKPTSNEAVHFYSGQSQPSGALSHRRVVRFWSGVDTAVLLCDCELVQSILAKQTFASGLGKTIKMIFDDHH